MKHLIYALTMALMTIAPISGHALSLSTEVPEGVVVSSITIDATQDLKSDHYICLGDGWDKVNLVISTQISELNSKFPKMLKDMGEAQKNCFAPAEIPQTAQKSIDEIIALIDVGAGDQLQVIVGESGEPTVSSEFEKNSYKLPKNLSTLGQDLTCESRELGLANIVDLKADLDKFELKNQNLSYGKKLLRTQLYVGAGEMVGMGILIALPSSITKWKDDWKDDAKRNLKRAWTSAPVWDKDEFVINYIGHPLAGAAYYNMLRSQGATRLQSLVFSAIQSTIWEYGIEAIAEQPSIQDLFVTPLIGSLLGELAHLGTERMRRNGFTFGEKVLVTIINPSYVLNNGFRTGAKRK